MWQARRLSWRAAPTSSGGVGSVACGASVCAAAGSLVVGHNSELRLHSSTPPNPRSDELALLRHQKGEVDGELKAAQSHLSKAQDDLAAAEVRAQAAAC